MAHVAVTVGGAVPVEGAVVEEAATAPSLIDYSQFLMGIEGDFVLVPFWIKPHCGVSIS